MFGKVLHKIKIVPVMLFMLATVAVIGTQPVSAAGATRYVATTGTNAGNCSNPASPCLTITYAIGQANNDDIIDVAAGTFSEVINASKPLTINGAQAGVDARNRSATETVLQTPGGQDKTLNITANNVVIDGFTFNGATGTNSLGVNLLGTSAKNAIIRNNVFTNNKVALDSVGQDISGLRASKNLFKENDMTGSSNGIFLGNAAGTDIQITDNKFIDTDDGSASVSAAMNIYGTDTVPLENVTIQGNASSNDGTMLSIHNVNGATITSNTSTNQANSAAIRIDFNMNDVTISGNNLQNGINGIRFAGEFPTGGAPATNVTVSGNTIANMTAAGILFEAGSIGGGIVLSANTFSSNAANIVNNSGVGITITNDVGDNIPIPAAINTGGGGAYTTGIVPMVYGLVAVVTAASFIAVRKFVRN